MKITIEDWDGETKVLEDVERFVLVTDTSFSAKTDSLFFGFASAKVQSEFAKSVNRE
jgi:hypothetical protein